MDKRIETIMQQIDANGLNLMIGANSWSRHGSNGISFRFKMSKAANYCKIIYLPETDLYRMELIKIGNAPKFKMTTAFDESGLYAEDLMKIFRDVTGLETRMPKIRRA
jgi:hypothetical protein